MPDETDPDEHIDGTDPESTAGGGLTATRRGAMALAGLAGLGVASGSGAAQSRGRPYYNWRQDVDARGHSLEALDSLSTSDTSEPIRDFAGENLEIDDGVLHASGGGGGSGLFEAASETVVTPGGAYSGIAAATVESESVVATETHTGPDGEWRTYVDDDTGDLVTEYVGDE